MNFERWHIVPPSQKNEAVLVWRMDSGKFLVAQQYGDRQHAIVKMALLDFDPKRRWRWQAPSNLFINNQSYAYTKQIKGVQNLGELRLNDAWQWYEFVANPAPFLMEHLL